MFEGWQFFYQTTGEAAATLIGLLFVVATLATGRRASTLTTGMDLFTSPSVFHLVSVLVISALALAPPVRAATALMAAWSLGGLVYAVSRAVRIAMLPRSSHWSDFWWYGAGPSGAYVALTVASGLACYPAREAVHGVALALLVLLVIAIRNAWDLVTWLAPRRGLGEREGEG